MIKRATLSIDTVQRYTLERIWDETNNQRDVWVMLNPSTADAEVDDATIQRCLFFSQRSGDVGGLIVINLWSLRSTDPKALLSIPVGDPALIYNEDYWRRVLDHESIHRVIAAWGSHAGKVSAPRPDLKAYADQYGYIVECLGINRNGSPKHPLYLPNSTALTPYPFNEFQDKRKR